MSAHDPTPYRAKRMKPARWFREFGWRHLVMAVVVAFALFPVIVVISASFNPRGGIQSQKLIPSSLTLDNYRALTGDKNVPFYHWMRNTVVISGVAALANTFLSALAAYSFSRMRFKGRRSGLLAILLVQMFPITLLMVAIFLMMQNIGGIFPAVGLGTQLGLILVYMGGALGVNTWLMKGFFDTVPRSLDESALIDGATHWQIFWRIILPLAAPVLAVVAMLGFITAVNEYVLASVLLRDVNDFPLSVGLFRFIDNDFGAEWGPFAAGALLSAVPVVVLFQFLQRFIVSGLTAGAVKE